MQVCVGCVSVSCRACTCKYERSSAIFIFDGLGEEECASGTTAITWSRNSTRDVPALLLYVQKGGGVGIADSGGVGLSESEGPFLSSLPNDSSGFFQRTCTSTLNLAVLLCQSPSRGAGHASFSGAGAGRGGGNFGGKTSLVSCLGVGLGATHYGAPDPPADLIYPTEKMALPPRRGPCKLSLFVMLQSIPRAGLCGERQKDVPHLAWS